MRPPGFLAWYEKMGKYGKKKIYLGIDIGGTAVKLGLVDADGHVLKKTAQSVCFDHYRTPVIETVKEAAVRMLTRDRAFFEKYGRPVGVGVSAAGQIDVREGIVIGSCGNLPDWTGTPIKRILSDTLALPVTVANDANCMCLGEQWVGAAAGISDVIGITLGTGVGGGIITGGRLLEGSRGIGGEIGHLMTHAGSGVLCSCGQRGCYERYASSSALVRRAYPANKEWKNGLAFFEAVRCGEPQAEEILQDWINEIAAGLIGLVHIFNPAMIIVGGGVSAQEDLLIRPLERAVKQGVMPAFAEGLTVKAAVLKNDAGMIGAICHFIRQTGEEFES